MAKARTTYSESYPVGNDYDGLLRALEETYERRGQHEVRVADARELGSDGAVFRLSLKRGELETLTPAVDEGWTVLPGEQSARAVVTRVDYDEDQLVVRCTPARPGNRFAKTIRLAAPDFLAKLRLWLEERKGRPFPALLTSLSELTGVALSQAQLKLPQPTLDGLRAGQLAAVLLMTDGISYLWGPPGTGKTYTVSRAVASLAQRGYKVAFLAPTNVAVDTAVLAMRACFEQAGTPLEGGFLVRAGQPVLEQLESFPELLAWQHSLAAHQQEVRRLRLTAREVEAKLATALGPEKLLLAREQAELKQQLAQQEVARSEELWRLAAEAKILAATVYGGLHRQEMEAFFSAPKVALVIDEAAMVPRYATLPLLELLGGGPAPQGQLSRPPTHVALVLAGDPRQLGPIHAQRNERDVNSRFWMGQSLMESLLEDRREASARTSLLTDQSRMDVTICGRVSTAYYAGRLQTVADAQRPQPPLAPGWPDDGLVVVDAKKAAHPLDAPHLSKLRYEKKKDERTLQVAVRLIREALAGGAKSVLWLSPFRDQARLAAKLVDLHFSDDNVRAGTVHTSQGGEADLIIFDPVTPRHRWLQGLIGGELDIERLLNVAVSRGRAQVIVFASRIDLAKNDLFRRLLHDATHWDGGKAG